MSTGCSRKLQQSQSIVIIMVVYYELSKRNWTIKVKNTWVLRTSLCHNGKTLQWRMQHACA